MPTVVVCPSCAAKLRASDRMAGRETKFPRCGTVVVVPGLIDQAPEVPRAEPLPPPDRDVAPKSAATPAPRRKESESVTDDHKTTLVSGGIGLLLLAAGIWYYFGGGLEQQVQRDIGRIEVQVAHDAEREYEIAKRNGSAMDAYVHAGLVAAAYLQANDEENYRKWKGIEAEEAVRAGISAP